MKDLSKRHRTPHAWMTACTLAALLAAGCRCADPRGCATCAVPEPHPYAGNPLFSDSDASESGLSDAGNQYTAGKPASGESDSVVRGQFGGGRSVAPLPSRDPLPAPLPAASTSGYGGMSYRGQSGSSAVGSSAGGAYDPYADPPSGAAPVSPGANATSAYPHASSNYAPAGTSASDSPSASFGPTAAPAAPRVGNQWEPRPKLPPTDEIAIPGLYPGGGLDDPTFDPSLKPRMFDEPTEFIDINPRLRETQTGRFMLGVGVNSDAGLVGSIVLDEQNFDWTRFPRSWEDIRTATAWRGAGQRFRLEAAPGTQVQRYMATFQEPYLFNTQYSLGLSGFYYTRFYEDWDEDRVGGRVAVGRQLAPDLSATLAYRGAKVGIFDPVVPTPPTLEMALGDSVLHGFEVALAHDTRDNAFLATEGHLFEISFEQVVGTYSYPRVNLDVRKYFLIRQRPDGSGRHVLKLAGTLGWTGDDTPIYDHYFAGGFSTLRGFEYRGASPQEWGSIVGGDFLMLASIEYLFPITADDALRGVIFCDTGTVEPTISDWSDTYRVAPGFGFRIAIPAMGPAPIALDFAFPISHAPDDREEVFSFFVGFGR